MPQFNFYPDLSSLTHSLAFETSAACKFDFENRETLVHIDTNSSSGLITPKATLDTIPRLVNPVLRIQVYERMKDYALDIRLGGLEIGC